jgi:hypothetical protein
MERELSIVDVADHNVDNEGKGKGKREADFT